MEDEANEEDAVGTDRIGLFRSHGLSLKNDEAEHGAKQLMEATIRTSTTNTLLPMI